MSADFTYSAGDTIRRREVLHGRLWMDHPVTVVDDDGDVLAVLLDPGSPFAFHLHPFGPHPWSHLTCWGDRQVLQLYRYGDLYSVWKFFDAGVFTHWYINFESPLVRREAGFDTDDFGLDLIVAIDGTSRWKDVEDLNAMIRSGRMTGRQVLDVLGAAEDVAELLEGEDRWWSGWDSWSPP